MKETIQYARDLMIHLWKLPQTQGHALQISWAFPNPLTLTIKINQDSPGGSELKLTPP